MSDTRYHGRHRAQNKAPTSARVVGAGLVLPATATLAIVAVGTQSPAVVLAGSGASLGSQDDPATSADAAELAAAKIDSGASLTRSVGDRVARDNERSRVSVLSAEQESRATTEARLAAAAETAVEVKPTVAAEQAVAVLAPTKIAGGPKSWVKPVNNYVLTSGFAYRWGRLHAAQDFACPTGTPVKSMSSGVVIASGWLGTYGNRVEIKYWDGSVSLYAHNSALKVKVGDTVSPGQVVAISGNTGNSTGPHVHVEIRLNGNTTKVAPLTWMRAKGIAV